MLKSHAKAALQDRQVIARGLAGADQPAIGHQHGSGKIGGQVTAFRVLLAPSDTYDVEIFEGPREALRLTDGAEDIYDDMLIECVENRTGYILTPPFRIPSAAPAGMRA